MRGCPPERVGNADVADQLPDGRLAAPSAGRHAISTSIAHTSGNLRDANG